MRDAFYCMALPFLFPGGYFDKVSKWRCNVRITKCLECFQRAESDPETKRRVLNEGIWKAAGTFEGVM